MLPSESTPRPRTILAWLCALALGLGLSLPAPGAAETIIVDRLDDPDLTGNPSGTSLRAAIIEANDSSGATTIQISPTIGGVIEVTFLPTRDLPAITGTTTIEDTASRRFYITLANNDENSGGILDPISNVFELDGDTTLINGVLQGVEIENSAAFVIEARDRDLEQTTPIQGSGSFEKTGEMELGITGPTSSTTGITVSEGVLRGDTVSLTGDIEIAGVDEDDSGGIDNDEKALLVFDMPFELRLLDFDPESVFKPDPVPEGTFTGSTSGQGALVKTSSASQSSNSLLILEPSSGNSLDHIGGTFVLGGTLQASAADLKGDVLICGSSDDNTGFISTGDSNYQCTDDKSGTLVFDQSEDTPLNAILEGSGDVRKSGSGALTIDLLDRLELFDGDFYIDEGSVLIDVSNIDVPFFVSGRLEFVQARILGSDVTVESGGTLAVNNDGRVDGFVTINSDGLAEVSDGLLTGGVDVNSGGVLDVTIDSSGSGSAEVQGDVTVRSGGTVRGDGIVADNLDVLSGGRWEGADGTVTLKLTTSGTIAPDDFETLNANQAEFNTDSRFTANIEANDVSNRLEVTTSAEVNALDVDVIFPAGARFTDNYTYSLISAASLSANFANIMVNQESQRLWYSTEIDPVDNACYGGAGGAACLNLDVEIQYVPLNDTATTPNADAVTFALDAAGQEVCEGTGGVDLFQCDPLEDFSTVYEGLGFETAVPDLADAYGQMDGAELGSFAEVRNAGANRYNSSISRRFDLESLMSPRIDVDDLALGRPGVRPAGSSFTILSSSALAPEAPGMSMSGAILGRHPGRGGWTTWGDMIGIFGDLDATSKLENLDYQVYGPLFGFDYGLTDNVAAGITFGYLRDEYQADHKASKGSANTYQVGLYSGWISDRGYIAGSARYAYSQMDTRRSVEFGTPTAIDRTARGDFDGFELSGFVEGAYTFHLGRGLKLQPVGSLAYNYVKQDGFEEKGAASLNMKVDPLWVNFLQTNFGLRLGWIEPTRETRYIHPQLRLSWERDWLTEDRVVANGLLAVDGITPYRFDVVGPRLPKDRIVIGVSIESGITENFDMFLDYDARVWSGFLENAIALGFRLTFF